jgi:hypothetical protein
LPRFIHNVADLIRRVLFLARPYGRAKLAAIFLLSLAQALFQVIGITSIFPFLAIAADPERIRRSHFGMNFLSLFPPMENRQLLLVAGIIAILALLLSNAVTCYRSSRVPLCTKLCSLVACEIAASNGITAIHIFIQRNPVISKKFWRCDNYAGGVLCLAGHGHRAPTAVLYWSRYFSAAGDRLSAAIVPAPTTSSSFDSRAETSKWMKD